MCARVWGGVGGWGAVIGAMVGLPSPEGGTSINICFSKLYSLVWFLRDPLPPGPIHLSSLRCRPPLNPGPPPCVAVGLPQRPRAHDAVRAAARAAGRGPGAGCSTRAARGGPAGGGTRTGCVLQVEFRVEFGKRITVWENLLFLVTFRSWLVLLVRSGHCKKYHQIS